MTSTTLAAGTKVRVSHNPSTLPADGYVSPSAANREGEVTGETDSHGNVNVRFDGSPGNQWINPAHLTPTEETAGDNPAPHADRVGRITIVTTPDTSRSVWFYVVAALPDGSVYGVNIGTNSSYVAPEGDGFRFQTARVDGITNDPVSRLDATVLDALATFLRGTSPILASALTPGEGETPAEAYARGKREQHAEDMREFDAWKERATETAHEYANNNSLCSEFDRCMTDIGLRPRRRDYDVEVAISYSTTVTVEADNPADAADLVRTDWTTYVDTSYDLREYADVEIGDVEIS